MGQIDEPSGAQDAEIVAPAAAQVTGLQPSGARGVRSSGELQQRRLEARAPATLPPEAAPFAVAGRLDRRRAETPIGAIDARCPNRSTAPGDHGERSTDASERPAPVLTDFLAGSIGPHLLGFPATELVAPYRMALVASAMAILQSLDLQSLQRVGQRLASERGPRGSEPSCGAVHGFHERPIQRQPNGLRWTHGK